MNIHTSHRLPAVVGPGPTPARRDSVHFHAGHEAEVEPLNEAIPELADLVLDLSHLDHHLPGLAQGAQLGVAGVAGVRAYQCFQAKGWEAKLEGAAALALATAGVASALPGGLAHLVGHGAHAGHGLLELGLGAHHTMHSLKASERDWKQVTHGALGVVKGLAAMTPAILPELEHLSHFVELGAVVGRLGLNVHH